MLEILDEIKVLKDPLYGYVKIEYQIIWDLIDCKELQRLKRIKQLGGSFQVYHTAEHSRFSHSIGVYEIVRQMLEKVIDLKEILTKREKVVVLIAALLHDLGHNPYSHAFETICDCNHEVYTRNIILNDSDINKVLNKYDLTLANEVASVINHTHKNPILIQLVSSELDADRMDYLLRDSYMTGTKYGVFDFDRIIRVLRVKDNKLVIKYSGINAVEDYVMSRYHMYHQVYFHPTGRSFEVCLKALFKRIRFLYQNNKLNIDIFDAYLKDPVVSNIDHYYFDENVIGYGLLKLSKDADPIINDLANRLLNRDLFKYCDYSDEKYLEIKKKLIENNIDPEYYLLTDEMSQRPYLPYRKNEKKGIFVLMKDGSILELSKASVIVKALVKAEEQASKNIFYPLNFQSK